MKDLEAISDSKMTIAKPTTKADSRNNNGRIGVCHNGWTLAAARTISVPNEDWCIHERTTPKIIKIVITFFNDTSSTFSNLSKNPFNLFNIPGRFTSPLNRSTTIGRNSIYSTVT